MDLQSLTKADVRELADSTKIFYRGEDYYESGMIQSRSLPPLSRPSR